jgi:putative NADH-flavin reductase
MKVLVMGATGGCGRLVVEELLRRGHEVTAFSRHASGLRPAERLRTIDGDAADPEAVDSAVRGQDAVVVTLGISENTIRVRLRGPVATPMDIRSRGTRTIVTAMQRHRVPRLIVQSTYGVGNTADRLRLIDRLFFVLLIKQQAADHGKQEGVVRAADGLDWLLVQPVHLSDGPAAEALVSTTGEVGRYKISRATIARVLADEVETPKHTRTSIAVSAAR